MGVSKYVWDKRKVGKSASGMVLRLVPSDRRKLKGRQEAKTWSRLGQRME